MRIALVLLLAAAPLYAWQVIEVPCASLLTSQPSGKPIERLSVSACRGEATSLALAVLTAKPTRIAVKLHAPSAWSGDVRLAQKGPVYAGFGCVVAPTVLVHDPTMMKLLDEPPPWAKVDKPVGPPGMLRSPEEYASANSHWLRVEKPLVDAKTLRPLTVDGWEQLWLTIRVSNDAATGSHVGTLTITGTSKTVKVPVFVRVLPFDLAPSPFEHSLYYPAYLDGNGLDPERHTVLTEMQMLMDLRNMVDHGCLNPTVYAGPDTDSCGIPGFHTLNRIFALREKAGIPRGDLFMFDGARMRIATEPLTDVQKEINKKVVEQVVQWAARRECKPLFMGADEATGEALLGERDTFESVHAGGGRVWVAGYLGYETAVADLLDVAIVMHPGALVADRWQWEVPTTTVVSDRRARDAYDLRQLTDERFQRAIRASHAHGNRVFTYMDPTGAWPYFDDQRRCRGLGLWKAGIDGTMTWAYFHYGQQVVGVGGNAPVASCGFVVRGLESPIDTVRWEGYREGYNDARYLATLHKAIADHPGLEADKAQAWLDSTPLDVNLDRWRNGMISRIVNLEAQR